MTTVNLIVWIIVYSICLVHITLFTGIFIKHKNKIELLYLIVLLNIFLLAVIITLSLVFRYDNFIPVLVNGILSLYVTVPIWGYYLFNVKKKFFLIIPALVITEAVIENILLAYNTLVFLYISRIVFYILLTMPIFIKKKTENNSSEPLTGQSLMVKKMRTVVKITVTLFVVFMASLIPFSRLIFEISYVSSLFWAVFTLAYQIPGLVYCVNRLSHRDADPQIQSAPADGALFEKAKLSILTKRENEVASFICAGLKYSEIAEKLFISLSAVKKHAYSIYQKLGIKNNRELVHIFFESQKNGAQNNTAP